MASRMALVGCKSTTDGPWTQAKGNEIGLRVVHLLEGEQVRLEMEVGEIHDSATFLHPGLFAWPFGPRADRYRVCKEVAAGVEGSPTTVEVMLRVNP